MIKALDTMTRAYITCALWSSTDEHDQPLDAVYSADDLAPEAVKQAEDDCKAFARYAGADLDDIDAEQAGHDFWLTRNHHGAGFWDRGLGELGRRLTDAAHTFGSCDAYIGDDGNVYFS